MPLRMLTCSDMLLSFHRLVDCRRLSSKRTVADCRIVVLATIQRLFTWCDGSANESEEGFEWSEGGHRCCLTSTPRGLPMQGHRVAETSPPSQ
jgi:hypothetical protein